MWLHDEDGENLSASTIQTKICMIRQQLTKTGVHMDPKQLKEAGIYKWLNITSANEPTKKAKPFTKEELWKICESLDSKTNPQDSLYKLLLLVSVGCLLRLASINELTFGSFTIKKSTTNNNTNIRMLQVTYNEKKRNTKSVNSKPLTQTMPLPENKEAVSRCPVRAYENYLELLRMNKGINVDDPGEKIWKTPRNGRFVNQNFGYHSIESIPKILASTILHLTDLEAANYTSHSFRRTGATLLAEAGASDRQIATIGSWGSSKIVSEYVDRATTNLATLTGKILGKEESSKGSSQEQTFPGDSSDEEVLECFKDSMNPAMNKRPRGTQDELDLNSNSSKLSKFGTASSYVINVTRGGIVKMYK